jgi:hypothetical protein
MTFAKLSATGKDAGRSFDKTAQNKGGVHPARAHYPYSPQIRWILIPGHPRRVGGRVTTPVAKESEDSGLEVVLTHKTVLINHKVVLRFAFLIPATLN